MLLIDGVKINLMGSAQIFFQVMKFFNAQIRMIFLQKIDSSNQFDKLQGVVFKRFNYRDNPLSALRTEEHEKLLKAPTAGRKYILKPLLQKCV